MIIALQGERASFHDMAARQFFGEDIQILPCNTFTQTIQQLEDNKADYAVVAIENSLFGSINEVYDLLLKDHAWIMGEVYLRIVQCLIGLPNAKIKDIKEVHSHPVALAQCEEFLDTQLPNAERFEHHDTAGSVADVKRWGKPEKAAIASRLAAELHGLNVLAEEIETNKENYTRFVVISKKPQVVEGANKTSLIITTDHKPGALYRALGIFAKADINLSKLQSRPIIGQAWHYMFYIDVEEATEQEPLKSALKKLVQEGCKVTVLGSYQAGTR